MEIALIPPIDNIEYYAPMGSMDLILPHMWQVIGPYRQAYIKLWRKGERYIILDNGAAEEEHPAMLSLVRTIESVRPNEFALPDVMGDFDRTQVLAKAWLRVLGDLPENLKIGYVAQGHTLSESLRGVGRFLDMYGDRAQVVYIPRVLIEFNYATVRLELAREIQALYPQLEIHLFGMSPRWPQEVVYAELSGIIRSVDTSLPFYYAQAGIRLTGHTEKQAKRSTDYFAFPLDQKQRLTERNVRKVLDWVKP